VADYTAKRIDDMDAGYGGGFKRARAELGVESFGMQVLDFPPDADRYPEHDHAEENQEEVFLLLRGSGWIDIDGERLDLDRDTILRVGPAARRKLYSGSEGMRVLALGGVPGKAYEVRESTQVGGPDPVARSA
jgi:mannose-6-phosphate isomerase-like protein (cupin superfamily)